jgi:predicted PurR-regulated permease PerM
MNPPLLFIVLWAVLVPFRGREGHAWLLGVVGALTAVWLLSTTGTLLAPFVLSAVLAYMLDPLVDALQRRRIPRSLAIVVLTLPALGLLALLLLVGVPAAARQLASLVSELPTFFGRLADWIDAARSRVLLMDIPLVDEDALLERLRAVDADAIASFLNERQEALGGWLVDGALGLGRGIGSVLTILGYVALTPVLTFYLLRDWDSIPPALAALLPADRRASIVSLASEGDRLVARYLHGQVIVALTIGAITALGLWLVSFPYAATLGLIVAVFSVVPYLGLILSLVPAIFIALVSGSVGISLLKVLGVYGVAQLLETSVISPRIVGESVGLHPVWVVLALAVGGFFFGFVGLLVAVPAAAIGKLLVLRALERYRAERSP